MKSVSASLVALAALALPLTPHAAPGDRTEALLRELSNAAGPPGYEEDVRKIMVRQLKPLSDQLSYDGLGSVIARQGGEA